MILDIERIMNHLKETRRVFVSEADLQLAFAWAIKELYPQYRVRLEYCPTFDQKMHIDILVKTDNGWIPIELKYKTKACTIVDGDETFVLTNHSAKDINCYMYLKDLQRIETIRKKTESFLEGYAIMLTNEPSYLKTPTKTNCIYAEFSLHNGAVKTGTMRWKDNASPGTIRGNEEPITLIDQYIIQWILFSQVNEKNTSKFYYLVCQII